MTNPILEELYNVRDEILAEHRDDLGDFLHSELARAKAAGHPVAKISQRSIRRIPAAKSSEKPVANRTAPAGQH